MTSDTELEAMCERALAAWLASDPNTAVSIWTQAAALGSPRAHYNLGVVAEEEGDIDRALAYFEEAANAQSPYPRALYNLSIHVRDIDKERAALLAERAADLGLAAAAYNLGQWAMWDEDYVTASRWWRRAMDLGDGQAAYNLAIQLDRDGDPDGARETFWRSAELGYPDGMNNVAVMLRADGEDDEALAWCERAAAAGSTLAMRNLADLATEEGQSSLASTWLQSAADLGDEVAQIELARLANHSTLMPKAAPKSGAIWMDRQESSDAVEASHQAQPVGVVVGGGSRFCVLCGTQRMEGGRFCTGCGASFDVSLHESAVTPLPDIYQLELVSVGDRAVAVMSAIRTFTDLGLADVKVLIAGAPTVVGRFDRHVPAEAALAKLQEAGAVAHLVVPTNRPSAQAQGYRVVIDDAGTNMIPVIKEVRRITGLGLVESKALVLDFPCTVTTCSTTAEAERVVEALTRAGARASFSLGS